MKEIDLGLYEMSSGDIDLVSGGDSYSATIPVSPQGAVVGAIAGFFAGGIPGAIGGAAVGFFVGPYM